MEIIEQNSAQYSHLFFKLKYSIECNRLQKKGSKTYKPNIVQWTWTAIIATTIKYFQFTCLTSTNICLMPSTIRASYRRQVSKLYKMKWWHLGCILFNNVHSNSFQAFPLHQEK